MRKTKIEWTEMTLNPLRGCSRISDGCINCYAERIAARYSGEGMPYHGYAETTKAGPRWTSKVEVIEHILEQPYRWTKPRMVFVNSMSDMFHEKVELHDIQRIFKVFNDNQKHQFQILTKRSKRLAELHTEINWTENIWMGVSVEDERVIDRIDHLRNTNAKIKFLSIEPLIGPIPKINLQNIDWVIVGGESGPNARPMLEEWVLNIKAECNNQSVPFFFKQWGGINKKATGRLLQGETYDEFPKAYYQQTSENVLCAQTA